MAAALGDIATQHKEIKRAATPQISYSTLFRIFLRRQRSRHDFAAGG
jgi:hypothetical protein